MLQTKTIDVPSFVTWLSAWLLPATPAATSEPAPSTITTSGAPNEENHVPTPDACKEEYIVYLPLFVP